MTSTTEMHAVLDRIQAKVDRLEADNAALRELLRRAIGTSQPFQPWVIEARAALKVQP